MTSESQQPMKAGAFNLETTQGDYPGDELEIHVDQEELMTIECETYVCSESPKSLVRVEVEANVCGEETKLPMLIDCGASSSFINPTDLPAKSALAVRKIS